MTTHYRVLLIDSIEADAALAELALRHHCPDVQVVTVRGALDYAEQLAAGGFHAVVCEQALPWADGMAVLAQLRGRLPAIPLFLLGTRLPEQVASRAVELGLAAYLEKTSAGFLDMARAVCRSLRIRGDGGGFADSGFDHLPVGLLGLAADGTIERSNRRAREVLGHLGTPAPGTALTRLLPELAEVPDWQRLLAGGLDRFEHVTPAAGEAAGKGVHLLLTRRPPPAVGLDGLVEPAVELDAAGAGSDLAEVNAELEQLAYALSHDLQEPLQLILRNARLLAERYEDQLRNGGGRFLGHLVENSERMQSMIDGVLAYSRLLHGERNLQPISVDDLVDQVLENLKPQIEEAGATIERHPLPVVRVDRFQIQQLLTNLIANALKFRAQRPLVVAIDARDEGSEWRFAVRDNGIGFDSRFQDRIFKMFQRLHTSEEYPGTGIGLAVSKKIVEQYGGRIWVESRQGEGTSFFFTLPK